MKNAANISENGIISLIILGSILMRGLTPAPNLTATSALHRELTLINIWRCTVELKDFNVTTAQKCFIPTSISR
jgi:hypothetical protein